MSYSYTVAETETRRVRLVHDDDSAHASPRDDDEFACGALTIPDHKYNDVSKPGDLAETARGRLFDRIYFGYHEGRYSTREGVAIFERWVRVFHGGVTLYDTPHDGPAVVWYMTPAMMRDRGFTGDAATDTDRMEEIIAVERTEYRAWAKGDVWGYVLEERTTWMRVPGTDVEVAPQTGWPPLARQADRSDTMETWEEVESVWGFIGSQYAEEEARAALQYAAGTDA